MLRWRTITRWLHVYGCSEIGAAVAIVPKLHNQPSLRFQMCVAFHDGGSCQAAAAPFAAGVSRAPGQAAAERLLTRGAQYTQRTLLLPAVASQLPPHSMERYSLVRRTSSCSEATSRPAANAALLAARSSCIITGSISRRSWSRSYNGLVVQYGEHFVSLAAMPTPSSILYPRSLPP